MIAGVILDNAQAAAEVPCQRPLLFEGAALKVLRDEITVALAVAPQPVGKSRPPFYLPASEVRLPIFRSMSAPLVGSETWAEASRHNEELHATVAVGQCEHH